jgi:hypothetical protein
MSILLPVGELHVGVLRRRRRRRKIMCKNMEVKTSMVKTIVFPAWRGSLIMALC